MHNITPASIKKEVLDIIEREYHTGDSYAEYVAEYRQGYTTNNIDELKAMIDKIRDGMLAAAEDLEFEKAAVLRDQMMEMEKKLSLLEKAK